jgi:5,10-methylenetetrahydromethanopterin reductase
VADGVILAEPTAPQYVAQALEHVGHADGQVVAFAVAAVDDDASAPVARVRPALPVVGESDWAAHLPPLPFAEKLAELRPTAGSADSIAEALPDEWVRWLALAGSPGDVRASLTRQHEAGAQTVVLIPVGSDPLARLPELARVIR